MYMEWIYIWRETHLNDIYENNCIEFIIKIESYWWKILVSAV